MLMACKYLIIFPISELAAMKQPLQIIHFHRTTKNTNRNIFRVFMFRQRLASKHYGLRDFKLAEGCLKLPKISGELKRLLLLPI